jgi:hypothetical protein
MNEMGTTTQKRKTKMSNHRSNFALAAGVTLAIAAITAGSASAMGNHASSRSMGNHQTTMNQPTMVKGITTKPRVTGLTIPPGKVTGLTIPPGKVTGLIIPPKGVKGVVITGILKPPVTGVIIPPVTGVIVTPPNVVVTPPEEVTWTRRRYPWYAGTTVATAQPAMSTAVTTAPCNCLTKEYLQDGSVLFKDLCTKEAAILTVEEMKGKQQGANLQNQ